MKKINIKKILINALLVIIIFAIDRVSKLYILNLVEINDTVDIYLNQFVNLFLVWNQGIAFGLFSFEQDFIYNIMTVLIIFVILIILIMIIKSNDYKIYFLTMIFGGSIGNVFDRLYYSAVPDFIDLHINDFHWFIFNVADIFISFGVICLIFVEIFFNKETNK